MWNCRSFGSTPISSKTWRKVSCRIQTKLGVWWVCSNQWEEHESDEIQVSPLIQVHPKHPIICWSVRCHLQFILLKVCTIARIWPYYGRTPLTALGAFASFIPTMRITGSTVTSVLMDVNIGLTEEILTDWRCLTPKVSSSRPPSSGLRWHHWWRIWKQNSISRNYSYFSSQDLSLLPPLPSTR